MARVSWIDGNNHPTLDEHISQLEHFTQAIADGVVDKAELAKQEKNLITALRTVEPMLSDAQHEAVTKLLAELGAFTVMTVLHDMTVDRVRRAIR